MMQIEEETPRHRHRRRSRRASDFPKFPSPDLFPECGAHGPGAEVAAGAASEMA